MLFVPHRLLNSSSYELWTDTIFLCNPDCYLLELYSFEPRFDIDKPK